MSNKIDQMGKDTIFFKYPNLSKSYNIVYFKRHFSELVNEIKDAEGIYYKFTDTRNSWFDIKKSFNHLTGYIDEKFYRGSYAHKINPSLAEISNAIYTDKYGYTYNMSSYDGLASLVFVPIISREISKNIFLDFNEDLIVDFNMNITDALITCKHLFYRYEVPSTNRIKFKKENIPFNLATVTFNDIEVFKWLDVKRTAVPIKPVGRDEEWFTFQDNVDPNSIVIYNNVMYLYDIHPLYKNKIRLKGVTLIDYKTFNLDKFQVYKFYHNSSEVSIRKVELIGNNNTVMHYSTFGSNKVTDGMILYNGAYHKYTLSNEDKRVAYNVPTDLDYFGNGIVSATAFSI